MKEPETPQLHMVWPETVTACPQPALPSGFTIRTYCPGDEEPFLQLMAGGEFDPWDEEKLAYNKARIIPEGWFFAAETATGDVCGTGMCLHNYTGRTPFAGDLGWLAVDPAHRGKGLGSVLTARVTARFLAAGYRRIQLHTESYRLPAVKVYLRAGYLPLIGSAAAAAQWRELCQRLEWPFDPAAWTRQASNLIQKEQKDG